MTVAVVGGHSRFKSELKMYAKREGVKLKLVNEWGPYAQDVVTSADYVLVITGCVSHNLAGMVKRCARGKCLFCNAKGLCKLKETMGELKRNHRKVLDPVEKK